MLFKKIYNCDFYNHFYLSKLFTLSIYFVFYPLSYAWYCVQKVFRPLEKHAKPNRLVYYRFIQSNAQATPSDKAHQPRAHGSLSLPNTSSKCKVICVYIKQKTCAPRRKCECLLFCKSKAVINANVMLKKYKVVPMYELVDMFTLRWLKQCSSMHPTVKNMPIVVDCLSVWRSLWRRLGYTTRCWFYFIISFYKLNRKMYKKCCIYMLWLTSIIRQVG